MEKKSYCLYEYDSDCWSCSLSSYGLDCQNNPIERLISLAEYAEMHGKAPTSVRQMAQRGGFKTARKIGRNWVIDADEPYPDRRIKSGKYVGRKRHRERKK